jgi:hypothetical protein
MTRNPLLLSRNPLVYLSVGALLISLGVLVPGTAPGPDRVGLDTETVPTPGREILGEVDLPTGVSADWWATVCESIEESEYHASRGEAGLQAPNRAQNLRTRFRDTGIEIVPRDRRSQDWIWTWKTATWGRPPKMARVEPAAATFDAARIEYAREGFVEWYENRREGIEQGFTVDSEPPGEGPLRIEGLFGGGLLAQMSDGDGSIDFLNEDGVRVLRYSDLVAWDAGGQVLPTEIDLADESIRLTVDDRGAVYPITIDPIMTVPDWYAESDSSLAHLGHSVSTAGDVNGDGYSDVIIGAHGFTGSEVYEGRAYVFHGSPSGLELSPAWWTDGGQERAFFGNAVSTAGDVNADGYDDVIIGAHSYDSTETSEGRAYVYLGSPSGIESSPVWTAVGEVDFAFFGFSVAGAGDVNGDGYDDVIVGARWYSHGQTHEGQARVYYGTATGVSPTPAWSREGNLSDIEFGRSVCTAGDVNGDGYSDIIVGVYAYFNGEMEEGAAYVFHGSAAGLPEAPDWIGESNNEGAHFGSSVSTAGDVNGDGYGDVIVGAPDYTGDIAEEGAAFVFHGSASGLEITPAWVIEGDQGSCSFGSNVRTAGDVNGDGFADVIVGAYEYEHGHAEEGRAYVYLGYYSGLATTAAWIKESDEVEGHFGFSVSTAGDVNGDGFSDILVGSPSYSHPEEAEGLAFVYHSYPDGPREQAGWVTESNQESALYGYRLAYAGDVNGDGYSDVLVGAYSYDNGENCEGAVFLFLGSHLGLTYAPVWFAEGNQELACFGHSVSTAGDVNGDGWEDLLVGAMMYDGTCVDEGGAFLWYSVPGGGPPGNPDNADWCAFGGQEDAHFGCSVATAGDVNADGYADIIVGAPGYDHPEEDEGAAFVFHGSETGPSTTADWFHECDNTTADYGTSVASAGDFNGDGYSDVVVGARLYDLPGIDAGLVSVHLGSAEGVIPGDAYWCAESDQDNAILGHSVACAGDVNGDGYSDIIAGAPCYDTPTRDGGMAFVWQGGSPAPPNGNPDNAAWFAALHQEDAYLGIAVASAGDVNGDGYSDIIIGAYGYEGVGEHSGAAFVYLGSASGLVVGAADWIAEGNQAGCGFGRAVAGVGDVNGDGFSDIAVGAPYYTNGQYQEGRVYNYYGNNSRGLARIPQQWQSGFTDLIAPLLRSDSETEFGLQALGRTPEGRGTVRLVYEVKPFGIPFDGTGLGHGPWTDTGVPSGGLLGSHVTLSEVVGGLYERTPYHWRLRCETKSPYFSRSPWLTLPYNCMTEADLRTAGTSSSVSEGVEVASALRLASYPNPFHPRTIFTYTLGQRSPVRLEVFDVQGRLIATLVEAVQNAGQHVVSWDARSGHDERLPPGIYFAKLRAGGQEEVRKVVLTKVDS